MRTDELIENRRIDVPHKAVIVYQMRNQQRKVNHESRTVSIRIETNSIKKINKFNNAFDLTES